MTAGRREFGGGNRTAAGGENRTAAGGGIPQKNGVNAGFVGENGFPLSRE